MHVRATAAAPHPSLAPFRCDPEGDRTIALMPEVLAEWLRMEPPGAPGRDSFGTPWYPRSSVPGCGAARHEPAEVSVTSPAPGSVFLVSNRPADARQAIEVRASVTGGDGALPASVDFFLDGKVVARSKWPYATTIRPTPGDHEIVALPQGRERAARVRASRFTVW